MTYPVSLLKILKQSVPSSASLLGKLTVAVNASEKELCRRSFYHFVKRFWRTIETRRFIDNWHIKAICDHLQACYEGRIQNLLINIPPRHGKSLIVNVFFPAWVWCNRPIAKFVFFSYAATLTIRDSVKCRKVIASPLYQNWFGDCRKPREALQDPIEGRFQLSVDQNAKGRYDNNHNGCRIASSVGGTGTGEGGDYIITDDPHNAVDIESETTREFVIEDWWMGTISTRDDDMSTTCRIVIMQRLHEKDLTGHIVKNEDGWVHLRIPIRFKPSNPCSTVIGFKDPRTEKDELLWKARYTPEQEATLRKRLGSYRASGQLDQEPAPAEGGKLKRGWWKRYDEDPREMALKCEEILQSWDMPFKGKKGTKKEKGSDNLCCTIWGRIGANRYMLDRYMDQREFTEALKDFKAMSLKWPNARKKLVEDAAYASSVISVMHDKIDGIVEVDPKGDKMSRVIAAAPSVESGNVFLPSKVFLPGVEEFIDNCANFPNAEFDDDVDTFTQMSTHWHDEEDIFNLIGLAA